MNYVRHIFPPFYTACVPGHLAEWPINCNSTIESCSSVIRLWLTIHVRTFPVAERVEGVFAVVRAIAWVSDPTEGERLYGQVYDDVIDTNWSGRSSTEYGLSHRLVVGEDVQA